MQTCIDRNISMLLLGLLQDCNDLRTVISLWQIIVRKLSNGNGQKISELGPSHCFVLSLIFPIDPTGNDRTREARRN